MTFRGESASSVGQNRDEKPASEPPPVRGARRSRIRNPRLTSWLQEWIDEAVQRSQLPVQRVRVPTFLGDTGVLRIDGPRDAEDVVCIPGWGTNGAFWLLDRAILPLTRVARVTIVDVPGQPGSSPLWAPPYTKEGYDRWLTDVLDGLGIESTTLVGASMGACLAVRYAFHARNRVARMGLLAPAGFIRPRPTPDALLSLLLRRIAPTPATSRWFLKACLTGSQQSISTEAHTALADYFTKTVRGFANRSLIPPLMPLTRLKDLDLPIVVLLGQEDAVFPIGPMRRAAHVLPPTAALRVLLGHGHLLEVSSLAMDIIADLLLSRAADK